MNVKSLFLLFLSCLSLFFLHAQKISYSLSEESKFSIQGNTNVYPWTITTDEIEHDISLENSLEMLEDFPQDKSVGDVSFSIPVASLSSDVGGIIDDKIKTALKADKHPKIEYVLNKGTLKKILSSEKSTFIVQASGQLTLAGIKRRVEFPIKGKFLDNGLISLEGVYDMQMTQFSVKPPSAMYGQIQTEDDIKVTFSLTLYPNQSP
ncbi:MAG: YceI family protein [Bacteroidota bacterium]